MNKRDLIFILGIAILLIAAVSGFELALRGVPEAAPESDSQALPPSLTARNRSNVRAGDSTGYPIVGKLEVGVRVAILGISRGSAGWYYIELPDGARGFISPGVVVTQGDLTNLPAIDPASLSATATPPPATLVAAATQAATPTAAG